MWIIKVLNECRGWPDYIGHNYQYQCRPELVQGWDSQLAAINARLRLIETNHLGDIMEIIYG